jgi:S-adenosylmethionine-diacylgycerolhomoserine-N-methlytransferase
MTFDSIFFSYSISMIPPWKESVVNALSNLKPGGSIFIVDFYDQRDLPGWFRYLLVGWLRKFHVQFWGDLVPYLEELERQGKGKLEMISVARRYAFIAVFSTYGP